MHTHTADCYQITDKLTCTKTEHEHTAQCYSNPDADVETAAIWEKSMQDVKLSEDWSKDVLAIADSQLNYHESRDNYTVDKDGNKRGYTRYGAWYGDAYGDWCAMFVSFCAHYAGVDEELLPREANCGTWIDKLAELKIYHRTGNADDKTFEGYVAPPAYMPNPGDLIFFDWEPDDDEESASHVGLVYELIKNDQGKVDKVKTIEGNYNDEVCYNTYDLTDKQIMGYATMPKNPNPPKQATAKPIASDKDKPADGGQDEDKQEDITLHAVVAEEDMLVTLNAPAGSFGANTQGLKLEVAPVADAKAEQLMEEKAGAKDTAAVQRRTKLFDIKVMQDGKEVQPENGVAITFRGIDVPNNDAVIYHVADKGKSLEDMQASMGKDGTIVMETEHFSIFGISFTVDFHNGDVTFSIAGESEVMLSTIFEKLNIDRNITDVKEVEFSDPTLIKVEKAGDDWKLTSLKSFETDEELTVTFKNGEVYKIPVTDPPFINGVPQLTPTNNVTVINETTGLATEHATLAAAMQYIGPGIAGTNYWVVFTKDYTSTQADWNEVASKGAQAQKITFTSTYNDGTNEVTRNLTLPNGMQAAMSTQTEFRNISFQHGATNPSIYASGYKLIMGENITNSTPFALQIYGGSMSKHVLDTDVTVLSGSYKYVFSGGCKYSVTGQSHCEIGGEASVNIVYPSNYLAVNITSYKCDMVIDGTNGAKVNNIYASYGAVDNTSRSSVTAGTEINVSIRNMKDINSINFYSYNFGLGKLTIDGGVQVRKMLSTNKGLTDVELANGATLTMGSNSDESVAGTSATYHGRLYVGKDLILNSNSKLIFAGTGAADSNMHRIVGNIKVNGSNAEIDIFKSGTKTYPIYVEGTGSYIGTNKLKLGVHKDPNTSNTTNANRSDILLKYNTVDNAKEENYAAGTGIDGVMKSGGNIIADKLLDDPIDVGIGRVVVGEDNPNYNPTDPTSKQYRTVQYVGDTDMVYAHDNGLQPSYTFVGTNLDANAWKHSKIFVVPKKNITTELVLAGVKMVGNGRPCMNVSESNTTIVLKDGTQNEMSSSFYYDWPWNIPPQATGEGLGGGIAKNGMDGTLTIKCEHSNDIAHRCDEQLCGKLNIDCSNGVHVVGIGSEVPYVGTGYFGLPDGNGMAGFSGLTIRGGNIEIKAGRHMPAIGTGCGVVYRDMKGEFVGPYDLTEEQYNKSQAAQGQICSGIDISGGRTIVFAGEHCAGIGSGWAGPVEDITISNGAYVHAEGGTSSPGIGSGGQPVPGGCAVYRYGESSTLKNLTITGGDTVVEAVGGTSPLPGKYIPGIGIGQNDRESIDYNTLGRATNINAVPDVGYSAIVKQGTSKDKTQATYIDGAPSTTSLPIKPNQFYTLVFFSMVGKTASVSTDGANWDPDDRGAQAAPVPVQEGDYVRYKLDLGSMVENGGAVSNATLSDPIPAGMTLVRTPGSYTANGWQEPETDPATGITTVKWRGPFTATNKDFYFTVRVDNLPAGVYTRDYVNAAKLAYDDGLELPPTLKTYHRVKKDPPPDYTLTVGKTLVTNDPPDPNNIPRFTFTVDIRKADGTSIDNNVPKLADCTVVDSNGNAVPVGTSKLAVDQTQGRITVELADGDKLNIAKVPAGYKAIVSETSASGQYTLDKYSVKMYGTFDLTNAQPLDSTGNKTTVVMESDKTVNVVNTRNIALPHTGGSGTMGYTIGGIALMLWAIYVSISMRRKYERRLQK